MKSKIRSLLWISLLLSIILISPDIKHRVNNESINKSVIIAADFYELNKTPDEAKDVGPSIQAPYYPIETLLEKLKLAHISTLAVKEFSDLHDGSSFGFDIQVIEMLKNNGFEIILRPLATTHSNEYYEMLDSTISRFGIKYIIFDENSTGLSDLDISAFSEIFTKNNVFLILSENRDQTGYVKFLGLDKLIEKLEYNINRTYILSDSDLKLLKSEDMQYRWLRAIVDRNIRVIYVRPLASSSLTVNQNIQNSLGAASELSLLLVKKGYDVNYPLNNLSSEPLSSFSLFIIMLNLILAIMLYYEYLSNPSSKNILSVLGLGLVLSLILKFFYSTMLSLYAATGASIIYPSLACLLLLKYWQKAARHPYFRRLLYSLIIIFCVLSLGAATITAAMSDLKYTFHLINFSGAMLTYTLPVAVFSLNYLFGSSMYRSFEHPTKKRWFLNLTFYKGLVILLTALVLYIYLSRGGNNSLLPATNAELAIRNWFERILPARPRFKEFAIGYPCLFVFLFLQKRNINPYIMFYLGCGITIGLISIINSFCHGFTTIAISMSRTLSGFLIGTLIGSTLIIFLRLENTIFKSQNQSILR